MLSAIPIYVPPAEEGPKYPSLLPASARKVLDERAKYEKRIPALVKLAESMRDAAQVVDDNQMYLVANPGFETYAKESLDKIGTMIEEAIARGKFDKTDEARTLLSGMVGQAKKVVSAAGGLWVEKGFGPEHTLQMRADILKESIDPTRRFIAEQILGIIAEAEADAVRRASGVSPAAAAVAAAMGSGAPEVATAA
jgi:hypothetical protein